MAGAPNISDKKFAYVPPALIENNIIPAKQGQKINRIPEVAKIAATSIASSTTKLQQENAIIQYLTLLGQYAIDNKQIMLWIIVLLIILLVLLYIAKREKK